MTRECLCFVKYLLAILLVVLVTGPLLAKPKEDSMTHDVLKEFQEHKQRLRDVYDNNGADLLAAIQRNLEKRVDKLSHEEIIDTAAIIELLSELKYAEAIPSIFKFREVRKFPSISMTLCARKGYRESSMFKEDYVAYHALRNIGEPSLAFLENQLRENMDLSCAERVRVFSVLFEIDPNRAKLISEERIPSLTSGILEPEIEKVLNGKLFYYSVGLDQRLQEQDSDKTPKVNEQLKTDDVVEEQEESAP